jgi:hypothetical protein
MLAWTGLGQSCQSPMNCLRGPGSLDQADLIQTGQFEDPAHHGLGGAEHYRALRGQRVLGPAQPTARRPERWRPGPDRAATGPGASLPAGERRETAVGDAGVCQRRHARNVLAVRARPRPRPSRSQARSGKGGPPWIRRHEFVIALWPVAAVPPGCGA